MSFFISTSRKPGQQTRKLAKWLSLLLGFPYENRGKQSVEDVSAHAKTLGFSRVLFIHERKGNPRSISFFEGKWIEPEIELSGVVFPETESARIRKPGAWKLVCLTGEAEKYRKLFSIQKNERGSIQVFFGSKEIFFKQDGNAIGPVLRVR